MSRPFDGARYEALLEGLEITIIKRSQLNKELRYEAEYFRKRYLIEDSALSNWKMKPIESFADVTDGPHGYHIVDDASPIVMLTAKNARGWFTDRKNADPIAESVDTANKRSSLKVHDVILSTRGTVGLCALVTSESLPANIDQDVARISWQIADAFLPEFVVAYLNCKFGQDYMIRQASGMVQQGLSLQKVRKIPIPLLSETVQGAVTNTLRTALGLQRSATAQIAESEVSLLRSLGLENWQPPEPLTYSRRASDAFAASRLDADYYSPAKFDTLAALAALPHRALGEHCHAVREMFDPFTAGRGVRVRNFDLGDALRPVLDDETPVVSAAAEVGSMKKRFQTGDVVISRLRSYLREIAVVRTSPEVPAVGSSEFIVLRPRAIGNAPAITPETLLVFLRSRPVQTILKWCQDGSHHPRFGEEDLLPIPVPDAVLAASPEIDRLVNAALTARLEARALLERAKRAVEIAIEESEAAALRLLGSV